MSTFADTPDAVLVDPVTQAPVDGAHVTVWTADPTTGTGTKITALTDPAGTSLPGYVASNAGGNFPFKTVDTFRTVFTQDPSGKVMRLRAKEAYDTTDDFLDQFPIVSSKADNAKAAADAIPGTVANSIQPGGSIRVISDQLYSPTDLGDALEATGTPGMDDSNLIAKINEAADRNKPLHLIGHFRIQAALPVVGNIEVRSLGAVIEQTAHSKSIFTVDGNGTKITGVGMQGIPGDWVNSSTVYSSLGIHVLATASNVALSGCSIIGVAGAGIQIEDGAINVDMDNNIIIGPGSGVIGHDTAGQFSAGIRPLGSGSWSAEKNDISGYAQGIVAGAPSNQRIIGNQIHDLPGQHGLYLKLGSGSVVEGNLIWNTGIDGMKYSIEQVDATDIVINGNVFRELGGRGIAVINTELTGHPELRGRRIIISNNVVTDCGLSSNSDAINVDHGVGVAVFGNLIFNSGRHGINVDISTQIEVLNNWIFGAKQNGIILNRTSDFELGYNRIKNAGSALVASNQNGIQITGSDQTNFPTTDGMIRGNVITDANAKMQYGVHVGSGDQANIDFLHNITRGATSAGFRGLSGIAARSFYGNQFGTIVAPPSNFPSIPNLTAAPTQTDVNNVLAALRQIGAIQ